MNGNYKKKIKRHRELSQDGNIHLIRVLRRGAIENGRAEKKKKIKVKIGKNIPELKKMTTLFKIYWLLYA